MIAAVHLGGRFARVAVPLLALFLEAASGQQVRCELVGSVEPAFAVADQRLLDLDGDGRAELVVVGRRGEVRTWSLEGEPEGPAGSLVLASPARSLLAFADLCGRISGPQLVVLSPKGVELYQPDEAGAFGGTGKVIARRARFRLRLGRPTFADFLRDIDGDGLADLVLPRGEVCELWMNGCKGEERTLHRVATIPVTLQRDDSLEMGALSDRLLASFSIPRLDIRDLNGDKRPDLIVRDGQMLAFHLQRASGEIPPDADVRIDLDMFRDTTREGSLRLGRALPGQRRATLTIRDLNQDGIPDYVISHLRKIWVFHGTDAGPRLERPVQILKLAEDITWLQVMQLDEDGCPDLALVRVTVPTLATLIQGVFTDFDVSIAVLDYPNQKDGSFATSPRRRRELTLRVPAITSLLRNLSSYIERVEGAAAHFRESIEGDFDGDGRGDVAMVSQDAAHLEIWSGVGGAANIDAEGRLDEVLRRMFFEDPDPVWDLDRLLSLFGDMGTRRALELTGGRAADVALELRPPKQFADVDLLRGDVDGRAGAELILSYRRAGLRGSAVYDLLRISRR